MSNRGGNGGYAHGGVQPNHTSSRNFGPNRAPNLPHQPRHMIPQSSTNIPQNVSNVGFNLHTQYMSNPGLVHQISQVPQARYSNPNHHQHHQQFPIQLIAHHPFYYQSLQHMQGNQFAAAPIARGVPGTNPNTSPYNVSQGMVAENQLYYNEPYNPLAQTQELNTVTPALQHIPGQTLPNKGTSAPKQRHKAIISHPDTLQVLSEDYLKSPITVNTENVPDKSSNTNATSTTPKTGTEKKVKESMNDLDVRIDSDQVTIPNVVTPEPTEDSSNSSSTISSNALSSKQAVIESKPPKTGSDKTVEEQQANDLDDRNETDQITLSIDVTPEPTEDSSNSSSTPSSTTHSSKQAVIEDKPELKSIESTTQVSSPVNEEIPDSNEISSSSESKENSTEEIRQPAPIDVVDHAAVMTREESISPQNDLSQSKEISETSIEKVSPSETEEEIKGNEKPSAVEHPKLNAKGKYEYEADFLRSLQSHPLSLKKPDLPDLDIVQQVPITQREKQTNRQSVNDFLPSYLAPSRNNRSLPLRISGRNSRELRPSKPPIKIIPSPSLNQDVSLHTVENAWKPAIPALKTSETVDGEDKKLEELIKRFRGILNKLTPQKYDDLIKQVDALAIDTESRLTKVLELIFDKAVDEPAFCTDYAKLCKHISTKKSTDDKDKVSEKDDKTKEKQFKQLLLKRCQNEFESDIYKDVNIEDRLKEIETITDAEKKKIAKLELDEDKRKARKRTLGIIKFIGELFMFDMLRVAIMDSCIHQLLKQKDDESLECLCTLLRTVGEKWENDNARKFHQNHNNQINFCIGVLRETVQQRLTSSRVRFMIQDVLDMKQAGWKVRKIQAENKPKTIEQLHAEIQQEEQNKKHEIQQHINKTGDTRKIPSKQDDWNSNSQRNRTNTPNMLQTIEGLRKMDLNTSQADTISLGPQRGLWGSGASLGAGTSAQRSQPNSDLFGRNSLNERDKNPRNSGNNSGRDSMEGRIQSSTQSFRPFSSMDKDPHSGYPGRASIGNRMPSTMAPFANTADSSVKKETSSRGNSMEKIGVSDSRASNNSNNNSVRESPKKEVTQVGTKFKGNKDFSDDKVAERATNCVKEFMHHGIKEDARDDVLELCTDKNVHIYVKAAVEYSLELASQEQRLRIGDLLGYLVKEKVIKTEHFCKGLHGILEIAADLEVDIPLLWQVLADVLVPLFCSLDNSNRKKLFTKALEPCKEVSGGAVKTIYHILNYNKQNKSPYDCASAWVSGELEWSSFLPSNEKNPEKFLEELGLTMPVFDLQIKLDALSNRVKNHNPNQLLEYISNKFTPEEVKEAKFLRALTEAVVNKCVSQSGGSNNVTYKLNKKFSEFCPILAKFHNGSKNLELEIIFTVQVLVADYVNPKGLLSDIFDNLARKANISCQAFIEWEGDTRCVKNKGPAMIMVKDFLTKLKEGGSGSDS